MTSLVKVFYAASLLLFCVHALHAAVQVTLHPEVVSSSADLRLRDCATLTGPSADVEKIGDLIVQQMPGLGTYSIEPAQCQQIIKRFYPRIRTQVVGKCLARRATKTITTADCITAAESALRAAMPEAELEIRVQRQPVERTVLQVPGQPVTIQAEPVTNNLIGQVPYRLVFRRGDQELARTLVVFSVIAFARMPVAMYDIPRGESIQAHQVRMQRVRVSRSKDLAKRGLEHYLGRTLATRISAGETIPWGITRAPIAVRSGTTMTLLFRNERFTVSSSGEALASGAVGDVVRVRQANGRVVRARISAIGQGLVNF